MVALQSFCWLLLFSSSPALARSVARDTTGDRSRFLPEIPSARQEHSVATIGNNIYIVGGISSNYSFTPDTLAAPASVTTVDLVQSYNIKTRMWSDAARLPVSINHGNIASISNRLYLLGGLLGLNLTLWGGTTNSYVYNPRSDTWSDIAPLPEGTARGASAMGVRGSEIYMAGGMRQLQLQPPYLQESVALVSSYNTRTRTWNTNYPPLPAARDHVGGAVIGNKFYVTGGRELGQYNLRGDTWSLNLDNPNEGWKTLASMPTPRGGLAATAVGSCIYTFGGEGNRNSTTGTFDNVEVYDIRTDTWERLPPLWAGIHGTNAVVDRNIIYIPGGGYKVGAGASNFTVAYKPQARCFR